MVTRKAVPAPLKTNAHSTPPYPTSPVLHSAKTAVSSNTGSVYSTDLGNSPAFDLIDVRQAQRRPRRDSESSRDTWNSEGTEQDQDTPAEGEADAGNTKSNMSGQQITSSNHTNGAELPPSLRIGAAAPAVSSPNHGYEEEAQSNPWEGEHAVKAPPNTNNPYLRQTGSAAENSQSAWQEVMPPRSPQNAPLPPPSNAPPPPPSNAPPPPPGSSPPRPPPSIPIIQSQTQTPSDRPSMPDSHASWTTVEKIQVPQQGQPPLPPVSNDEERPLSTWWHDDDVMKRQTGEVRTPQALPPKAPQESDYQPPIGPPPAVQSSSVNHEQSAAAPLRLASVQTSSQPSPSRASPPVPDTPGTKLQKQRNTTYQIRHVNWLDESRDGKLPSAGLRNSPIMTQNANGPCPLLALVNALVLTTPPDAETSLIETLRTREQISLGLLLDAVFDELVSNRREGSSEKLPDVSELYSFLLALHTGMNVNPRFVTPAATPRGSWDGVPPELNGVHPMHKAQHKTGAFEETMEMRLYSTFNIPLIHGWTAPTDTPAYEAFLRSAQTFEDAQNIQFMESDLEEKMRSEGLSAQETQTLEDIHVIKSFLNTWPTQLTDYGLETMSKSLRPGQVAILFRNDHFSTLYKEPNHGALMTLVTDAGYAGHDEIVWESLVDVNGAASEMFSGDFRLVSHGRDVRLNQGNSGGGEEGWTTVPSRSKRQSSKGANSPSPPPLPGPRPTHAHDDDVSIPLSPEQRKAAEQEDHDLALALQLQEEEEHQHRQAAERRQREQELSEQYISNESEGPRPPIPPRRSGQARNSTATPSPTAPPPVNRPSDNPSDPDAPPSYEQAASDLPYRPAGSTAAPAQGNAIGAYDALRRQQSAYTTQQQQQSSTSDLPTFAQAGPSSPPYTLSSHPPNPRRATTSGGTPNRLRRESQIGAGWSPMTAQRTNQIGFGNPVQRSLIGQGGLSPGHHPRSAQARSTARLKEANAAAGYTKEANAKDAEDRCVVM